MSKGINSRYFMLGPVIFVFVLIAASFISLLFLSVNNTLFENGRWIAGKTLIGQRPMYSNHFLLSRHALARGGADLSVWFGFHELFFDRKLRFEQLEFDLTLAEHAWVCVFFSKTAEKSYGLRLSTISDMDDMFFEADKEGLFTRKIPFNHTNDIIPVKTISVRINYSADAVYRLFVQDQLVAQTTVLPSLEGLVGFKGGKEPVLVDNVKIYDRQQGLVYTETFSNSKGFWGVFAGAVFTLFCLIAFFCWILLLLRKSRITILFSAVVFSFMLSLFAALAWGGDKFKLHRNLYQVEEMESLVDRLPSPGDSLRMQRLLEKERVYKESYQLPVVLEQIATEFGFEPDSSVFRVMFLGSSQTWGEGAHDKKHTFTALLGALLEHEKAPDGRKFEIINAGVSGMNLPGLLELYKHKLIALKPDICVINQSHADVMSGTVSADDYVAALEKFVVLNRLHGVQTVFIPEAVSRECWPTGIDYHVLLHQVAGKMDVPAWDMNAYMAQKNDDGWLWVDRIHFSPAGHLLASGFLHDAILFHLFRDTKRREDSTQ